MSSGSEAEVEASAGVRFDFPSSSTVPQAMQKIGKHKAKRAEIQKGIGKDHAARLAALKKRVAAHYRGEAQKISDLEAQKLSRLIRALEKRQACEDEISRRVETLRADCAHMAMLLGAVYEGRMEAAIAMAEKTRDSLAAAENGISSRGGGGGEARSRYEGEKKMVGRNGKV
ncbi:hypothetical protein F5X99DRAFT_393860 [Biscogniauxia marginata]|nr:hypothetical protein F5X99DRAFT_393860 [Biscogniauxia marginata]